jgi:SOS-response transcriptional repressor LexA
LTSTANVPAFATEVRGDALLGAGLRDGDLAWVDPHAPARPGDLVLVRVDARRATPRLQLCRLLTNPSGARYLAIHPTPRPQPLQLCDFEVIGRVTGTVCQLDSRTRRSLTTRTVAPGYPARPWFDPPVALRTPRSAQAVRVRD